LENQQTKELIAELEQVSRDGYRWRITGKGVIACEKHEDNVT